MNTPIGLAPFERDGALRGFVVSGRWPENTKEWVQLLAATVRIVTVPGLLATSTVFCVRERPGESCAPDDLDDLTSGSATGLDAIGTVASVGPVLDLAEVDTDEYARHRPPALFVLHPPSETESTLPECDGVASGCVLLPGLPDLGLDHRAGWVEIEPDGTVVTLVGRRGIDPRGDPDTAVLAMLLAG